jgi:hypothetical protein
MTQCFFDGPEKVSNEDLLQVEDELREARREVERKAKAAREDHDAREHRRRAFDESRRNREHWQASSGSRHWDSFSDKNGTKHNPFSDNSGTKRSPWQPQSWSDVRGASQASGRVSEMTIATEGTPYGVLDVPFSASSSDIKKAYRMVSCIWRLDPASFVYQ